DRQTDTDRDKQTPTDRQPGRDANAADTPAPGLPISKPGRGNPGRLFRPGALPAADWRSGAADTREPLAGGRTPLILCSLVRDRCWSVSLARLLLEKGAKVGLKDRRGMNALHYACAHGREELAELFLQAIDYRVDAADGYRNSAMHYAVRGGRLRIVEALAKVLQRLQLPVSPPNREGVTPLMLAYMADKMDIAAKLLEAGADADAVDAFGKATSVYRREAEERLRDAEEAAAAKAAGRKLRFDDVDGWRRYQNRLRSAPAGRRAALLPCRPLQQSAPRPRQTQLLAELRRTRMYQPESAELIEAASPLDRHNNPGEVFRTTPAEFFGPTARQQQQQHLSISGVRVPSASTGASRRPRARSAAPSSRQCRHGNDSDSNSDRSRDSREIRQLRPSAARRRDFGASDSLTMARLSTARRFYRPPPKPADPTMYVHDFAARYLSPSLTDADGSGAGAGGSEAGGGGGRRKKEAAGAGRKGKRGPAASAAATATAAAAMFAAESVKKKATGGGGGGSDEPGSIQSRGIAYGLQTLLG
uniref:ANK_REP_REGION domain-containing protein n=1 Tax=Macrostomum lignano TaxID=282301 RepID=A0A1I8IT17_9PLAT